MFHGTVLYIKVLDKNFPIFFTVETTKFIFSESKGIRKFRVDIKFIWEDS